MRTLLIGIGNSFRRDDGAGPAVARLVRDRTGWLDAVEHDGDPASLIDLWTGRDDCIVIDAIRGERPGTVRSVALDAAAFVQPETSSHGMGLGTAIAIARALHRLPKRLLIIGVAGASFDHGEGLSAPVQAAVERLVEQLAGPADERGRAAPSVLARPSDPHGLRQSRAWKERS